MSTRGDTAVPVAVAYVRSLRADAERSDIVVKRLREYGERVGFTVDAVLSGDSVTERDSGFLALMHEVRERDARAVILPSPADLSLLPDVRRWMARMLAQVGAQLVIVPEPTTDSTTDRRL